MTMTEQATATAPAAGDAGAAGKEAPSPVLRGALGEVEAGRGVGDKAAPQSSAPEAKTDPGKDAG